eukprot:scaffold2710_cov204-Pinguiococcus_pyrenoidosus.AAC.1
MGRIRASELDRQWRAKEDVKAAECCGNTPFLKDHQHGLHVNAARAPSAEAGRPSAEAGRPSAEAGRVQLQQVCHRGNDGDRRMRVGRPWRPRELHLPRNREHRSHPGERGPQAPCCRLARSDPGAPPRGGDRPASCNRVPGQRRQRLHGRSQPQHLRRQGTLVAEAVAALWFGRVGFSPTRALTFVPSARIQKQCMRSYLKAIIRLFQASSPETARNLPGPSRTPRGIWYPARSTLHREKI